MRSKNNNVKNRIRKSQCLCTNRNKKMNHATYQVTVFKYDTLFGSRKDVQKTTAIHLALKRSLK